VWVGPWPDYASITVDKGRPWPIWLRPGSNTNLDQDFTVWAEIPDAEADRFMAAIAHGKTLTLRTGIAGQKPFVVPIDGISGAQPGLKECLATAMKLPVPG